jgi:peptide-methionine (S)-S-oxide reductase
MQKATFGAGCFWGVEQLFRQTKGVINTQVGYLGGQTTNPTYEQVCQSNTGHAEVVEVEFDPSQISYKSLLDIFFENHNPTTINRQGPDVGSQYRSAIFFHSEEQKTEAKEKINYLAKNKVFKEPIVTEVTEASTFWPAEDYHQQYLAKRGATSCHI